MKIYMLTDESEYELPICVASSVDELARLTGANDSSIRSALSRARKFGSKSKWQCVEVSKDEGMD